MDCSLVTGKDQEDRGKKEKKKEKFSYRKRKICLKLKNLPFSRKEKILEGGIFMNISDLELNSIKRVGIDKIKLSGFAVEHIDMHKLQAMADRVEIVQSINPLKPCKRHMPESGAVEQAC